MTRSYNLKYYPDADYTPNDMGPPEKVGLNTPLTETEREEMMEKMAEMELDTIEF